MGLLWSYKNTVKSYAKPLGFQVDIGWIIKWFFITLMHSSKLWTVKVGVHIKFLDLLDSRLRFSRVYIALLLFGRPRFDSRTAQTLRAYSFAALWPRRVYSISVESPITNLFGINRGVFPKFATGLTSMTKSKSLFHVVTVFTSIR